MEARKDTTEDIQVPMGCDPASYKAAYARCIAPKGYDPYSFCEAFARGAQPPHGDDAYGYRAARAVAKRLAK
jgi:hypothetical protein